MEPRRANAFRTARFQLSQKLQSTQSVCDYLIACGELSDVQADDIMSKPTRSAQNSALCSHISTRGNSAYDNFRLALEETNAPDFLRQLLPDFKNAPQQTSSSGIDGRPTLTDDLLKRIDTIIINDSPDSRLAGASRVVADCTRDSALPIYQIDIAKKTGLALIINNVDFAFMAPRKGSDVDHHNMALLLEKFNFEIFEKDNTRNLREADMKDVIERFAQQRDHQKYSCSVVVILTHGKDGFLYATDSHRDNLVSVEWMLRLFQGDKCPNLNGKPKLFFLQACRGEKMDKGADKYGFDAADSAVASGSGDVKEESEDDIMKAMLEQNYDEVDAIARGDVIASQSDFFVAYATVPGYVSWRNSLNGSWFVQAMVQVFSKYSKNEDLVAMMTEVNRLVQEKFSSSSGNYKMTPTQTNQLTKKFYFPPYHHR